MPRNLKNYSVQAADFLAWHANLRHAKDDGLAAGIISLAVLPTYVTFYDYDRLMSLSYK